jgi:hypothetical protein
VSCYLVDANTPHAKGFLLKHDSPLPFSPLHELEVRNALRLGVLRQVITDEQATAAAAAKLYRDWVIEARAGLKDADRRAGAATALWA